MALEIEKISPYKQIILSSANDDSFTSNGTEYSYLTGSAVLASEQERQNIWSVPGIIKNFFLNVTFNNCNKNYIFTIRKNGVATSITVTIPASETGTFTDLTNNVTVISGDKLSLESKPSSTPSTGNVSEMRWSFEFITN